MGMLFSAIDAADQVLVNGYLIDGFRMTNRGYELGNQGFVSFQCINVPISLDELGYVTVEGFEKTSGEGWRQTPLNFEFKMLTPMKNEDVR